VTDRLDLLLKFHPFAWLNALLGGAAPGGPPPLFTEILQRRKAGWSRCPQSARAPEFPVAAAEQLLVDMLERGPAGPAAS